MQSCKSCKPSWVYSQGSALPRRDFWSFLEIMAVLEVDNFVRPGVVMNTVVGFLRLITLAGLLLWLPKVKALFGGDM